MLAYVSHWDREAPICTFLRLTRSSRSLVAMKFRDTARASPELALLHRGEVRTHSAAATLHSGRPVRSRPSGQCSTDNVASDTARENDTVRARERVREYEP